ncbi:DNA replication complex GINS protein PSF2 [Pestalotiopsis fici W106-1]|uniref:DNA replication complex GINS protein PSF2 n=1 Tax=Pestalotiopsis fici (strain W106-1 / CGMCC3.15140) TaxID=1229662 RepID=W3X9B8_PESFW|nr:DNA replication complex GINS protein PSF2 [Pestalotiopsis fici W106-1]ETS82650.1 DNA replication complex GINS protein PSF2 [Pestalotiopsis fici W106-1]
MALPLPPGLVPTEVAFLCEMELVTIVPRQRLESIPLLTGATPVLRPPHRADIPLWLALLLKKQKRANIVPPAWLHAASLADIIQHETTVDPEAFSPPPPTVMRSDGRGGARSFGSDGKGDLVLSPPFLPSCVAASPSAYLPYHWLELAETLLAHASDDIPTAAEVRTLLRDLQEVRAAKMRGSTTQLEGGGGVVGLRGVGAMELAESRGFVVGVVDGVRKLGASVEATRREEEERGGGDDAFDDEDEEMGFE